MYVIPIDEIAEREYIRMIDLERKEPGRRMAVTAVTLAAAIALVLGSAAAGKKNNAADPIDENMESTIYLSTADREESTGAEGTPEENTGTGNTVEETADRISTETAADEEPEDESSQSAAESKVRNDGEFVSEVLEPAGKEQYASKELLLINPWHLLPEDYEPELEAVEYGHSMDECAAEHLKDMLADCREEGLSPLICSSYRDRAKQEILFENDVRRFMYRGYSEEEARIETAKNVAVPGSSEHEAGLAADIVYAGYQSLDETQEQNETQQWLMEHCHEYGFILRYPRDKQEITGITYEPWHYRYVGLEAAEEITSRGICLEEYLGVIDEIR